MSNPGKLRHRGIIYAPDPSVEDAFGAQDRSARILIADIRCNVRVMSGSSLLKNGLELNKETISVLMRYRNDVTSEQYIVWDGQEYDIGYIKPDEKKQWMILTARVDG